MGQHASGETIGDFPGLAQLDEDDNLRSTSDFRGVYAALDGAVDGCGRGLDRAGGDLHLRGVRAAEPGGVTAALVALALGAAHLLGGPAAGPERAAPATSGQGRGRCRAGLTMRPGAAAPPAHRRAGRVRARCARITPRKHARGRVRGGARPWPTCSRERRPAGDLRARARRPAADPPAVTPQRNVSVTAREFSLQLSRPVVDHGRVGVQPLNRGEDPHNLQIASEASPLGVLLELPDAGLPGAATGDSRTWRAALRALVLAGGPRGAGHAHHARRQVGRGRRVRRLGGESGPGWAIRFVHPCGAFDRPRPAALTCRVLDHIDPKGRTRPSRRRPGSGRGP